MHFVNKNSWNTSTPFVAAQALFLRPRMLFSCSLSFSYAFCCTDGVFRSMTTTTMMRWHSPHKRGWLWYNRICRTKYIHTGVCHCIQQEQWHIRWKRWHFYARRMHKNIPNAVPATTCIHLISHPLFPVIQSLPAVCDWGKEYIIVYALTFNFFYFCRTAEWHCNLFCVYMCSMVYPTTKARVCVVFVCVE